MSTCARTSEKDKLTGTDSWQTRTMEYLFNGEHSEHMIPPLLTTGSIKSVLWYSVLTLNCCCRFLQIRMDALTWRIWTRSITTKRHLSLFKSPNRYWQKARSDYGTMRSMFIATMRYLLSQAQKRLFSWRNLQVCYSGIRHYHFRPRCWAPCSGISVLHVSLLSKVWW